MFEIRKILYEGTVKTPSIRSLGLLASSLFVIISLSSCSWSYDRHSRSSTVDFLYPEGTSEKMQPTVPHLKLPLSVGIAYVPSSQGHAAGLSEERKMQLMESVAAQFRSKPFISDIQLIPTAYLKNGGGFRNLDQIRNMLGVDVVALVSYDQLQHNDPNFLSLTYFTIVGSYIIPGEQNDTSTMLDTAVFHIPSRKLLFRAPGTSTVKGFSSAVGATRSMRINAQRGFEGANEEMIANLQGELNRFKVRVKENPSQFKVTHKPGYNGAGNLGVVFGATLCLLLLLGGRRSWIAKR